MAQISTGRIDAITFNWIKLFLFGNTSIDGPCIYIYVLYKQTRILHTRTLYERRALISWQYID